MTPTFTDADIRILDFPATPVALLEHRGDPARIGDTIRRFIAWRRGAGLSPDRSASPPRNSGWTSAVRPNASHPMTQA